MSQSNASAETKVLEHLKIGLLQAIDKLINEAKDGERFQSKELSEDYFITKARLAYQQLMLQEAMIASNTILNSFKANHS